MDAVGAHFAIDLGIPRSEGNEPWSRLQPVASEECVMESATLVERVRGEFIEMPGLQLTMAQAARLWGLDITACRNVVDVLVESAFLRWTDGGKIVRATR